MLNSLYYAQSNPTSSHISLVLLMTSGQPAYSGLQIWYDSGPFTDVQSLLGVNLYNGHVENDQNFGIPGVWPRFQASNLGMKWKSLLPGHNDPVIISSQSNSICTVFKAQKTNIMRTVTCCMCIWHIQASVYMINTASLLIQSNEQQCVRLSYWHLTQKLPCPYNIDSSKRMTLRLPLSNAEYVTVDISIRTWSR
jgi:hypothetical protein